jgi:hypothetical protein
MIRGTARRLSRSASLPLVSEATVAARCGRRAGTPGWSRRSGCAGWCAAGRAQDQQGGGEVGNTLGRQLVSGVAEGRRRSDDHHSAVNHCCERALTPALSPLPAGPARPVRSRSTASRRLRLAGVLYGTVDGGAGDGEQFSQLRAGVLPAPQLDQVRLGVHREDVAQRPPRPGRAGRARTRRR